MSDSFAAMEGTIYEEMMSKFIGSDAPRFEGLPTDVSANNPVRIAQ